MESVLVGVDRSASSRRAATFALERARLNTWRVTLAYIVNWSRYGSFPPEVNEARPLRRREEIAQAQSGIIDPLMESLERDGLLSGTDVDSSIRHGRPSEVLAELAEVGGHGLIVVGRTGDSHLKSAIFGSTPYRLVQHAPVPVVVVP